MASIIDLAMFLLVLFVLLPVMMIFAMLMRDVIYQNQERKNVNMLDGKNRRRPTREAYPFV